MTSGPTEAQIEAAARVIRNTAIGNRFHEIKEVAKAALIAAEQAAWQSMETAPKDGRDILVQGNGTFHGTPFVARWSPSQFGLNNPWMCVIDGMKIMDGVFDGWRPLPAPPTPDSEDTGT